MGLTPVPPRPNGAAVETLAMHTLQVSSNPMEQIDQTSNDLVKEMPSLKALGKDLAAQVIVSIAAILLHLPWLILTMTQAGTCVCLVVDVDAIVCTCTLHTAHCTLHTAHCTLHMHPCTCARHGLAGGCNVTVM